MNNFFAICARHRHRLQARLVEIDIVAVVLVTYQLDIVGVNYVSAVAAHQRCANERILYGLYFVAQHKAAEAVLVVIEHVHIVALGLDVVETVVLIAKINGIFKRKYAKDEIIEDNLKLNCVTKELYVDDKNVTVTDKEFELLKLLIENKGQTLKKDYIFNTVWGSDSDSYMQTLTVHIKWLREKIEKNPKEPKHVITVWGVGYRFE